jgi:hypothetical protein
VREFDDTACESRQDAGRLDVAMDDLPHMRLRQRLGIDRLSEQGNIPETRSSFARFFVESCPTDNGCRWQSIRLVLTPAAASETREQTEWTTWLG